MKSEYFNALLEAYLEINPSEILSGQVPDDWKALSSFPLEGEPTKITLKHPISSKEKELTETTHILAEGKKNVIKEIVGDFDFSAQNIEEFAKFWNDLPEKLQEFYKDRIENLKKEGKLDASIDSETLAKELVHFPADSLIPDHDWLSRLDLYATIKAAEKTGAKLYFLRFKISPVQGFIGNARTERDLWAGSHMLGYLTYQAISEIWHEYGPQAVIFPHLRGQPFFEFEIGLLEDKDELEIANIPNKVLAIISVWERESLEDLKGRIESKIIRELKGIFNAAWEFYGVNFEKKNIYEKTIEKYFTITIELIPFEEVKPVFGKLLRDYLTTLGQKASVSTYYSELFMILDQLTDFRSREFEKVKQPEGFKCTLCGEHVAIGGDVLGYFELRMKWEDLRKNLNSRGIYDIKSKERLCPLCLAKRFYPRFYALWKAGDVKSAYDEDLARKVKEYFEDKILNVKRFESVSEVAIKRPTRKAVDLCKESKLYVTGNSLKRPITWYDIFMDILEALSSKYGGSFLNPGGTLASSFSEALRKLRTAVSPLFKKLSPNIEVLYKENLRTLDSLAKIYGLNSTDLMEKGINDRVRLDVLEAILELEEFIGEPPKYYAILKMDGDNMGKVISGTKAVKPLRDYSLTENAPDVPRPVTPTVHIAITRSLSKFAVEKVPNLSKAHRAELIYAGGDDVFAIVPTDQAVQLAYELQKEFRKDWEKFDYLQGSTRSMSAGILAVYYKEPLYSAVRKVNELEHLAKESGRNALAIGYLTHSGNYYVITVNWRIFSDDAVYDLLRSFVSETENMKEKISTRFLYEVLYGVDRWPNDPDAIIQLLRYEIMRHSNFRKEEHEERILEKLTEILWIARNVRAKVEEKELNELGISTDVGRVNEAISGVIVDDPEKDKPLDSFEKVISAIKESEEKLWIFEIQEKLRGLVGGDVAKSIAGLVLKKQIKGAVTLIKILREMEVRA
ncbi:type III-B CRISPR-associated protein Cas10/Cmr2 [Thermococcus barophilus]|uniref:CRISPR-associated protein, Crm2 family n=1 Tax=Thermococcus barophilus TaxID=55802 RepID=A0A0S1XEP6_THEBA|nr:type III-B CRISPR-associated protein Cas10/Cmr2 [Thermococcus barophilus]ALM76262.1 CRISPR-associated protein, Crm2 family [Thermococcus barophilus]